MDNERKSKGKKSKDKEQTEIEKGKEEGKGKGKGKGGKNAKKKAAAQSAILPSSLPPPPSLFVDKRKSSPSTSSSSTSSSSSSTSSSTSSSILKSGSREGPAVPLEAPFWDLLRSDECNRVLIAGCGGGYDLFSGLPLFFALRKMGKEVFLASLAFTTGLNRVTGKKFCDICVEVTADSVRQDVAGYDVAYDPYFPELMLSQWFRKTEKLEVPVYTFTRTGAAPLTTLYNELVDHLSIDTIILADGGTDSLMRGDEIGLGTPTEDMASICAVNEISKKKVPRKILVDIGFGVDSFHGVHHAHFLENVAYHMRNGGFLGTFSLLPQQEEAQKFLEAYASCAPSNSIVCASVASAVEGRFGNYHHPATNARTAGSKLFINPLMSMYWCFDLEHVAASVYYLPELVKTTSSAQVRNIIHEYVEKNFRSDTGKFIGRTKATIPH